MVRSRGILEIIERDRLIQRAATLGDMLLEHLTKLEAERPETVSGVRGRGLMCAFDLPDQAARDALVTKLREEHGVLLLPCGPRSIRLRPALNIPEADLDHGLRALSAALTA
jgi:L-lysine 6-transaminase